MIRLIKKIKPIPDTRKPHEVLSAMKETRRINEEIGFIEKGLIKYVYKENWLLLEDTNLYSNEIS